MKIQTMTIRHPHRNDDWYYLLGYSDNREKIVTFRVDRMKIPKIMKDDAVKAPKGFSAADYANKVFKMYDGEEQMVVLECRTFFGWIFTYAGEMKLVGPDVVVDEYNKMLSIALTSQE